MNKHMEEDRLMNNELTTQSGLVNYNPSQVSLLEMRADSSRFPRLKTMPREQAIEGMKRIVSQAFLYRGQVAEENNILFIASALVDEILADEKYGASFLSLAEIQVVVKRAVLDSDMFGISVASLYKVIMAFVKGEGHLNQKQVEQSRREAQDREFKSSPVSAMLQAATGNFIKNHKTQ